MNKLLLRLAVALCAVAFLLPGAWADGEDGPAYTIEVDVTNQITTVYRNSNKSIVRQMICSTGIYDYTPLGTFKMEQSRPDTDRVPWYYITKFKCYVKYASRIKGPILFHSIPYSDKDMASIDREALSQLGTKASHGCIRLNWEDAQWIAENCLDGTTVKIFYSPAKKTALRELLLNEGYTEDCGLTYRDFVRESASENIPGGLGRGDTGAEVSLLQTRLAGLGFFSGHVTGVYDDATVAAVMRYQNAAGMTVNGVASCEVVDRIFDEDDIAAEYATLFPGCSGTLVVKLQQALKTIGLYSGEIDGEYDDALSDAVAAFCQRMGIEPIQSVTPGLRAEIYALADAPEVPGDGEDTALALLRDITGDALG